MFTLAGAWFAVISSCVPVVVGVCRSGKSSGIVIINTIYMFAVDLFSLFYLGVPVGVEKVPGVSFL